MGNIYNNPYIQNIVSGVIGGLVVFFLQRFLDKKEKKKEKLEKSIVGIKDLKILAQDFLYQYEPHKITINKIIEEFGRPSRENHGQNNNILYVYEFQNAKVEVCEDVENKSITSITLFSKLDKEHPVNCRLSFEEDDKVLGEAKISDVIIKDCFYFEKSFTHLGYETIIGCSNNYRQTRHLKYFYQIDGEFETIEEAKGQIIKQVCVTQSKYIYPFFSFYDTFYN